MKRKIKLVFGIFSFLVFSLGIISTASAYIVCGPGDDECTRVISGNNVYLFYGKAVPFEINQ